MQHAKLRMRNKPSEISYKNSVTGNTFCKPVTGLKTGYRFETGKPAYQFPG